MGARTWSRSSRVRNAMKKMTGLINLKKIRWLLALHLRRRSLGITRPRPFEYLPALTGCAVDDGSETTTDGGNRLRSGLTSASGCIADQDDDDDAGDLDKRGDDVDERAEAFIADFYRQLRLERQVSLERERNSFASGDETDETGSSF